jgi:uncharacterized protein YdaU (DUF1376 family)
VNYYERHIGDYLKDTAHLSLLEHGIYTRLLDVYYTRESALPDDQVGRLIGARTKDEKDALQMILQEFFHLVGGAWHQSRCDSELENFATKQAEKDAGKESAKERQQRARERRKALFHALREAGQVPSYDTTTSELEAMLSRVTNAHKSQGVTPPVTRDNTATQTPDTSNQTPVGIEAKASSSAAKLPTCPTQTVIDLYHEVLPNLPKVRLHTKDRVKAIRKVWEWVLTSKKTDGSRRAETPEKALEWLRSYFERATENDFLMGRTPRTGVHANWQCDIDFLMTERGMKQVIEKTKDSQ